MQALESSRNQCLAHNPPPLRDGISADSLVPRGPEPVMDLVFAANGPANVPVELCGVGHIPLHSRSSSSQMCTHNKEDSLKTQTATDPSEFRWSKNWRHKGTKLRGGGGFIFNCQLCCSIYLHINVSSSTCKCQASLDDSAQTPATIFQSPKSACE